VAASPASPSLAAPPPNDNFKAATLVEIPGGKVMRHTFLDSQDTTEATVQSDLFSPPLSGGGKERTRCNSQVSYGRTIWYLVREYDDALYEIETTGFDSVITHYPVTRTGRLTRGDCFDRRLPSFDQLQIWGGPFLPSRLSAFQVGGVAGQGGAAGGPLQVTISFYPDRDEDGTWDDLDQCPSREGRDFDGCLPRLRAGVEILSTGVAGGVYVSRLTATRLPSGSTVKARCVRLCRGRQVRRRASGRVRLRALDGRQYPVGARFEIRVTRPAAFSGSSIYYFGAIGAYVRFDVTRDGLRRTDRCLLPGSPKPRRSCG
jgi:hypothetical protein